MCSRHSELSCELTSFAVAVIVLTENAFKEEDKSNQSLSVLQSPNVIVVTLTFLSLASNIL
jgi:hypothetical protein